MRVKTPKPATIEPTSTPHAPNMKAIAKMIIMYLTRERIRLPTVLAFFPLKVVTRTKKFEMDISTKAIAIMTRVLMMAGVLLLK